MSNYAYRPLVVRSSGGAVDPVIAHMFTVHAGLTLSLLNRVDVSLNAPVTLLESGGVGTPSSQVSAFGSPAVGDLRLGVRARIFGNSDLDAISVHVGGYAYLSVNPRETNVSDGDFRGRMYLALAGRVGSLRYSVTGGFHGRPTAVTEGTTLGNDAVVTAALGFVALRDRLTFGPELYASTILSNALEYKHVNAEAILGVHYLVADSILVGVGAGPGLSQGAGTPAFRGLFQVAYSPAPARPAPIVALDTDADGVFDPEDLCPSVPAGQNPDPARRGCPTGDRDGDTVFDNQDLCPDEPRGEHPDPARAGCPIGDADRDGVLDDTDACREEPQGEHPDADRLGCPDGDDDQDTVLNHTDMCRSEAQGAHPDPARVGCPSPDRDRDTVQDVVDHCPDVPGAPSADPNLNGCPGMVRIESGLIRIVNPVFFATNRDVILPRSFAILTAVGDVLRANTNIRRVSVEGHTDDVGDDAANLDLSQRRANSVLQWLTTNGIDGSRLESHGFGETRPVSPGHSHAAQAQNRRVDFRITDPVQEPTNSVPAPSAPPPAPHSSRHHRVHR